ncbi:MAG: hypothetical protein QXU40_01130 [Candidatus Pacearchaeota archaeon]
MINKFPLICTAIILILLNLGFSLAKEDFSEGKRLFESKISCSNLTLEQLEKIGDYLMEQMHPGESHEAMDKMMGGEGSESLKQMHINIAKRMYCDERSFRKDYTTTPYMIPMMGQGMMGLGMTNMMNNAIAYQNYNSIIYYIIPLLFILLLIVVIILIFVLILKLIKK